MTPEQTREAITYVKRAKDELRNLALESVVDLGKYRRIKEAKQKLEERLKEKKK